MAVNEVAINIHDHEKGKFEQGSWGAVPSKSSLKRNWCPDSNAVKDGKLDMNQAAGSGSKKRVKVNSISENSVTEVCSFPQTFTSSSQCHGRFIITAS
ncbi:hypothetical protein LOK49_LG14G02253 [Camellia lanceoleosa]|uniref:Uncharacterized protein n=1 Tax=Camellia lanceoleosa TaxID=1840588 RepID=A0ACC0FEX0_9ERIC|nr:hypothetical protein LOK49_LG14G02253 [Camellia lanceoleosa]